MSTQKPFRPDPKQTESLVKAGRAAAIDARKESRAQGLDVTYIQGSNIYREYANGKVEKIGRVTEVVHTSQEITKGTVLKRAR